MSLLSPFDVVIWMTDGWPLYESRLKGKLPESALSLLSLP
nr:IS1 family transposase [Escherichia coli]